MVEENKTLTGEPTASTEVGDNEATLSQEAWIARRTAKTEQGQESAPEQNDPQGTKTENDLSKVSNEPAPKADAGNISPPQRTPAELKDESTNTELLEKFEGLDQDQKDQMAIILGTGAGKRISKLTQRAKTAEEQLAELRQQTEQQPKPWEVKEPTENPLKDLTDVDSLKEEYQMAIRIRDWAEEGLETDPDGNGNIAYDGDQGYDRKGVRQRLRAARKTIEEFIPAQYETLQAKDRNQQERQFYEQQGKVFFPEWYGNNEAHESKVVEGLMSDPNLKAMTDSMPQGKLFLAAAAETLVRRGIVPNESEAAPAPQPNGNQPPNLNDIPAEVPQQGTRPAPPLVPTASASRTPEPDKPRTVAEEIKSLTDINNEIETSGSGGMTSDMWKRKSELKRVQNIA